MWSSAQPGDEDLVISFEPRDLIRREQRALAREQLERKLPEVQNSGPATEMTKEAWKELREGLRKRLKGRER